MKIHTHYRLLIAIALITSGAGITTESSFAGEPESIPSEALSSEALSSKTLPSKTSSSEQTGDKLSANSSTSVSLKEYGPVKMGDTLSNIAYTLFPDGSLQQAQVVWSLYQKNPGAFQKNDINRLKTGSVLIVPDIADIKSLDNSVARNKILERSNNPPEDLNKLKQQIEQTRSDYTAQQNKQKLLRSQLIELENQVKMLLKQNSSTDSALNKLKQPSSK